MGCGHQKWPLCFPNSGLSALFSHLASLLLQEGQLNQTKHSLSNLREEAASQERLYSNVFLSSDNTNSYLVTHKRHWARNTQSSGFWFSF
jgi:hypothetical protein